MPGSTGAPSASAEVPSVHTAPLVPLADTEAARRLLQGVARTTPLEGSSALAQQGLLRPCPSSHAQGGTVETPLWRVDPGAAIRVGAAENLEGFMIRGLRTSSTLITRASERPGPQRTQVDYERPPIRGDVPTKFVDPATGAGLRAANRAR